MIYFMRWRSMFDIVLELLSFVMKQNGKRGFIAQGNRGQKMQRENYPVIPAKRYNTAILTATPFST
jgi:hypothetical protein